MLIHLTKVPLNNDKKARGENVEVPATTTLGAAAEHLKLDLKGQNVTVDGEPATAATVLKEGAKVRVTERPRGS